MYATFNATRKFFSLFDFFLSLSYFAFVKVEDTQVICNREKDELCNVPVAGTL